jgi:hypothetical protein
MVLFPCSLDTTSRIHFSRIFPKIKTPLGLQFSSPSLIVAGSQKPRIRARRAFLADVVGPNPPQETDANWTADIPKRPYFSTFFPKLDIIHFNNWGRTGAHFGCG